MVTNRDDFVIAIRSAFLKKGTQQRFSLFALIIISVILIFFESVDAKPLNYFRAILKDTIYRGSALVSYPSKVISSAVKTTKSHIDLYKNYNELVKENDQLKSNIFQKDFLILEKYTKSLHILLYLSVLTVSG